MASTSTSITDPASLRERYGKVGEGAAKKELERLDRHCRRFIELSPFLVMATADADGSCDASPKGDAPGFVQVLDEHTLLIPDRLGNNRVDGLSNILTNPQVGLIFFLPGYRETLRVNGRARISTDAADLERTAHGEKLPRSVIVVTVEQAFMHCGKALIRSHLWDPSRHLEKGAFPRLATVLADQINGFDEAETEVMLEDNYRNELY